MKKAGKMILQLAVFSLVILTGTILATSKFDNPLGIRSFVVLTGSMQPEISVGSIVITKKNTHYQKGDIISFKQDNVTVTHRIIDALNRNNSGVYKTKGDANKKIDRGLVPQNAVLGKEILTIPYIGTLLFFMRSQPGFIICIIIPAIVYIGFEFLTIKNELEKEIKKKYRAEIIESKQIS